MWSDFLREGATIPMKQGTPGWPLPLPTARCAWAVAAMALPVLLAEWSPYLAWVGLGGVLVVFGVAAFDWIALPPASAFRAKRLNRPVLSLGSREPLEVEIDYFRPGDTPVNARVMDVLPIILRTVAEPAPAVLEPQGAVVFKSVAIPERRGARNLGMVHMRVHSTLGLVEREVRFPLQDEVRVYPGVEGIGNAVRMLRRGLLLEAGARRSRRRGEGTSFESLREYVQGEDPRRIDWKATARRAKLISRHYEVERSQTILLMIDCGRWMTGDVDGLSRLDRVLNGALLLAHIAAYRDDRVGVLAFSDRIEAFVPPTKGRGAVERIMEAVYSLEARLVESDYRRAFTYLASKHRKRSLLVLFTDVLGPEPSRVLIDEARRSARRHLPLVVTVKETDVERQTQEIPTSAPAAYRQAAAEEILLEREHTLALMQGGGVHVLDCAPKDLGPAVVDRYLELKSRMLL